MRWLRRWESSIRNTSCGHKKVIYKNLYRFVSRPSASHSSLVVFPVPQFLVRTVKSWHHATYFKQFSTSSSSSGIYSSRFGMPRVKGVADIFVRSGTACGKAVTLYGDERKKSIAFSQKSMRLSYMGTFALLFYKKKFDIIIKRWIDLTTFHNNL